MRENSNNFIMIIKNGFSGLVYQGISIFAKMLLRIVVLKYIGVEVLGISGTISSLLSTLALAEMGFQMAVTFHLYEPLKKNDYTKINQILNVLRVVYLYIGIIFLLVSFLGVPLLGIVLKGIDVNKNIYIIYILMVLTSSTSYFLAYRRTLIYADKKEYISKNIDLCCTIISTSISLYIIVVWKNFALHLLIQLLQVITSNLVVYYFSDKLYHYIKRQRIKLNEFGEIIHSVKNTFSTKLAGYVYKATDNLVISVFVNTLSVGYYNNYTIFSTSIKSLVNAIFNSMTVIIGHSLSNNKNEKDFFSTKIKVYSEIRFILASLIVIPWILYIDNIIDIMFGKEYNLPFIINLLLATDIYIDIVYSACCEIINGAGLFAVDKKIAITGAILNVVLSIILCIYFGTTGVILGTVVSQVYFWGARSRCAYIGILNSNWNIYIIDNVQKACFLAGLVVILYYTKISSAVSINLHFIVLGSIIADIIFVFLYYVFFRKTENYRELVKILNNRS